MIRYSVSCKSMYWPARIPKINIIMKNILKYKNMLKFKNNINYNCNLILVDNKIIKKMNLKYRKINKATDVLTFISDIDINSKNKQKECDILLSAEIIIQDSKKNEINFYDHLTHLIIHSFLHINGFMHNKIKEFNEMNKLEIKILNKLGISNPYIKS